MSGRIRQMRIGRLPAGAGTQTLGSDVHPSLGADRFPDVFVPVGGVRYYPSKVGNSLNRRPYQPEIICGRAMLNPRYPVTLARPVPAMCDSGAFQDLDRAQRLSPAAALDRQLGYERKLQQRLGDAWHFEALVTYDQMLGVDEEVVQGKKVKRRGTEESARPAIAETLRAGFYYATQRARIAGTLCFAAQGASPTQYVQECVVPLLTVLRPGDWFAFGGFCIIGRVPRLKPLFMATLDAVLPLLAQAGCARAHLLGVGVTDMVRYAAAAGRRWQIPISTDSSTVEVNSVMGRVFDGQRWYHRYPTQAKGVDYHPCDLAHANLLYYDAFCRTLPAASG